MVSITERVFNLFNAFAYLVIPVLLLLAVIMMARKVPSWIFTTMLVGSVLRLVAMLPHMIYSLSSLVGGSPMSSMGMVFFRCASFVGIVGGIAFAVGLLGLATGMPFAGERSSDARSFDAH